MIIFRGTTLLFILLLGITFPLHTQVYTPRVTTDLLPDYTDIDRFVSWPKWKNLEPQAKADSIWKFITSYETGLYPIQGIYEDPDPGPEFSFYDERDLVKVLNVYGHGYCGLLSPTLDGIYAHAGFPDSRIHNMDKNHHCVTEVFYNGGWHYYDVDLRGMLYKPDGTVASLREAMTDRLLWTNPPKKIEPFYPLDDKARMFESFRECNLTPMYHWYKNGHTMDFVLRPGESVIRYWQPQGGRWHNPWRDEGGFDKEFLKRKFEKEPRGLKSKHDGWSKWTHGNVLFTYSPELSNAFEDFERGVYDCKGVRLTARGLETDTSIGSYAVFEVRTPYIIAGKVHEIDQPEKTDDAAAVYYRSLGPVEVSVSTDNGFSWQRAGGVEYEREELIDLTRWVIGKYGYLVRFGFRGKSGLAEMTLHTWGQLAPVSLPRLFDGNNPLHFATGDRYGYQTTVKEVRLNLRDPVMLEKYAVKLSCDYDPLRDNSRLKGTVVLKVDSKPGTKIKWFTAGGFFHTFTGKEASKTANAIFYSTEGPDGPWQKAVQARVPDWVVHWHYSMDKDIVLDNPTETVYLKYVGDPAVNQIWVYAHCLGRTVSKDSQVRVTHSYLDNGTLREPNFLFDKDTSYSIECLAGPDNRYIRFELPSRPAER